MSTPNGSKPIERGYRRPYQELPFFREEPVSFWSIPNEVAVEDALVTGFKWADIFVRLLLLHPFYAGGGLLYSIMQDMSADTGEISQGCALGFLARSEQLLRRGMDAEAIDAAIMQGRKRH